jgi:hypothetical protein
LTWKLVCCCWTWTAASAHFQLLEHTPAIHQRRPRISRPDLQPRQGQAQQAGPGKSAASTSDVKALVEAQNQFFKTLDKTVADAETGKRRQGMKTPPSMQPATAQPSLTAGTTPSKGVFMFFHPF